MTIVVPFDDTDLSRAALHRAAEVSRPSEEIVAVAVLPNDNAEYATERGWIDPGEEFDPETIVSRLSGAVADIAPYARFEYLVVDRHANAGTISGTIRNYATDVGARMAVVGSDNAGRIVSTVASIGQDVATETAYDTLIVRSSTDGEAGGSTE